MSHLTMMITLTADDAALQRLVTLLGRKRASILSLRYERRVDHARAELTIDIGIDRSTHIERVVKEQVCVTGLRSDREDRP